jgi:hypothetical protein
MKEANEIFEECIQKIVALSKKSEKNQEVFSLGILLFPLTQVSSPGVKK